MISETVEKGQKWLFIIPELNNIKYL